MKFLAGQPGRRVAASYLCLRFRTVTLLQTVAPPPTCAPTTSILQRTLLARMTGIYRHRRTSPITSIRLAPLHSLLPASHQLDVRQLATFGPERLSQHRHILALSVQRKGGHRRIEPIRTATVTSQHNPAPSRARTTRSCWAAIFCPIARQTPTAADIRPGTLYPKTSLIPNFPPSFCGEVPPKRMPGASWLFGAFPDAFFSSVGPRHGDGLVPPLRRVEPPSGPSSSMFDAIDQVFEPRGFATRMLASENNTFGTSTTRRVSFALLLDGTRHGGIFIERIDSHNVGPSLQESHERTPRVFRDVAVVGIRRHRTELLIFVGTRRPRLVRGKCSCWNYMARCRCVDTSARDLDPLLGGDTGRTRCLSPELGQKEHVGALSGDGASDADGLFCSRLSCAPCSTAWRGADFFSYLDGAPSNPRSISFFGVARRIFGRRIGHNNMDGRYHIILIPDRRQRRFRGHFRP